MTEDISDQEKKLPGDGMDGVAGVAMPAPEHPIVAFGDEDLKALMKRAAGVTAMLGLVVALILWAAMSWQDAALFAVGTTISILSIFEWSRLIQLINRSMDANPAENKRPRGVALVVSLFLVRLIFFAAAIYVSLRCFHDSHHGSPIVLACGLALGLVGLVLGAVRLIRG